MRHLALFMLALNPVLWASFYAMTKTALTGVDPITFSSLELCVAAIPAIGVGFVARGALSLTVLRRGILLGVILYAAVLASTVALYFTTATNTAFFPALSGVMGMVIEGCFFHRRPHWLGWVAGFLSLLGCLFLILSTSGGQGPRVGDIIALLAAFIYTVYVFCVGTGEEQPLKALTAVFATELCTMALLGGGTFLVTACLRHQSFHYLSSAPLFIYVGLLTTFLPTAIALYFQPYAKPLTVAFLYTLEPVFGAILAHVIDHETLGLSVYLAGGLIVAGSILETARNLRAHGSRPAED